MSCGLTLRVRLKDRKSTRLNSSHLGSFPTRRSSDLFLRRFGNPRSIDAHERVWLTFAGVDETAEVWLNGQFLRRHDGATEPFEFDITSLVQPRNELRVDVEGSAERSEEHTSELQSLRLFPYTTLFRSVSAPLRKSEKHRRA